MKIHVPFKLWEIEDKIIFIGGIVIYLLLILSGIYMFKSDFGVAAILFWGGIIGMFIHAYITDGLFNRNV